MIVGQAVGLKVTEMSLISVELELFLVVCPGDHFVHIQGFSLEAKLAKQYLLTKV